MRAARHRTPNPQPPTARQAATLLNAAWQRDADWGTLLWLAMTTGARRGELCALRWSEIDLHAGVVTIAWNEIERPGGLLKRKRTKTNQARRLALDEETVALLEGHRRRCEERAALCGVSLLDADSAYVFSHEPDAGAPMRPAGVTQRYNRLAGKLGINTKFHALRHYSATELIASGVDVRTVAGRLGHGGGG